MSLGLEIFGWLGFFFFNEKEITSPSIISSKNLKPFPAEGKLQLIDNMPGEKCFYMHISSRLLVCCFAVCRGLADVSDRWVCSCLPR